MYKKLLVICFLILFSCFYSYAQDTLPPNPIETYAPIEIPTKKLFARKDLMVCVKIGSRNTSTLSPSTTYYGLEGQYFLSDKISLNYNISYGRDYFRANWGTILGGAMLLNPYIYAMDEAFLYVLMIPEGVSYHHSFAPNWDFSPYLNLLSFDFPAYLNNSNGFPLNFDELLNFNITGGCRIQYIADNKIVVGAFAEYIWRLHFMGAKSSQFNAGLLVGYKF
jgi:hypothetical protein